MIDTTTFAEFQTDAPTELQEVRLVGGILDGETRAIHPVTVQFIARNLRGGISVYRRSRLDRTFCALVP